MTHLVKNSEKLEKKYESFSGICQCCLLSENNLKSMLQVFVFGGSEETYSDMLSFCYSIEILESEGSEDQLYLICKMCIAKLKSSFTFRKQIESVQKQLKVFQGDDEDFVDCPIKTEVKTEQFSDEEETSDDQENEKPKSVKKALESSFLLRPIPKKISTKSNKAINSRVTKKVSPLMKRNIKTDNSPTLNGVPATRVKCKVVSEKDAISLAKLKRERRLLLNRQKTASRRPYKLEPSQVICDLCKEEFPTHKLLICHMAQHFPNHICDLCGKLYVSKLRLDAHIKMTHDEEKVSCQICHKVLKKYSLLRHIRSHTGENCIYACRICGEKFVSYSTRVIHLRKVHNLAGRQYKCQMCPKTFPISGYLSKHVRQDHFQEKKHACTFCDRAFFSISKLKLHMVSHTGEKEYQCEVCYKFYARRQTLITHMKIHRNIKPHVCYICNKAFTQKCTLQGHMKVHMKS